MLGKDDKTLSNQGSPIRNLLCKTLTKALLRRLSYPR